MSQRVIDSGTGRYPIYERRMLSWAEEVATPDVCRAHIELGLPVLRVMRGPRGGMAASRFIYVDHKMSLARALIWIESWARNPIGTMHVAQFDEERSW